MDLPSFTDNSRKIIPEIARQIMEEYPDYVLLDVRSLEEYAWAYIEGATLIPIELLEKEIETRIPDKDTIILTYCHVGVRSAQAAAILYNMGYNKTFDIGGIMQWPYGAIMGEQ